MNLPEFEDLLFDLERFVVGELDHIGLGLEQRFVHVDLGVDIDGVVCDVEVSDDLGSGELVFKTLPCLLILDELTWQFLYNEY